MSTRQSMDLCITWVGANQLNGEQAGTAILTISGGSEILGGKEVILYVCKWQNKS